MEASVHTKWDYLKGSRRAQIYVASLIVMLVAAFSVGYQSRISRAEKTDRLTVALQDQCAYIDTMNLFLFSFEELTEERKDELPLGLQKKYYQDLSRLIREARASLEDSAPSCRKVEG